MPFLLFSCQGVQFVRNYDAKCSGCQEERLIFLTCFFEADFENAFIIKVIVFLLEKVVQY
ncbi:hypothetical protein I656_02991 [Geobacillus sp. WSUCF1]|nr:hypothetical protein I656_02991 [Geobacillus sp. WSUCF1]